MATTVDPDEDLVRRVGEGDPAAIQAMVARKLPRMLSLAQRMLGDSAEAEDVAQEAMLFILIDAFGLRDTPEGYRDLARDVIGRGN